MLPHKKKVQNIKKPWPTQRAMIQVYENKLWGTNQAHFYSGEGSHLRCIVAPYVAVVAEFLDSFENRLVVCDLGCGDFNIGKQLVPYAQKYLAVDIVPKLIAYNQITFIEEKIQFSCLDIAKDPLPQADFALIRQVLQHLSNAEITAILKKLKQYRYVMLTEHLPDGNFESNLDIISGQGTRLKKGSGVDILEPPFNFKVKAYTELLSIKLKDDQGVIKTTLYTLD